MLRIRAGLVTILMCVGVILWVGNPVQATQPDNPNTAATATPVPTFTPIPTLAPATPTVPQPTIPLHESYSNCDACGYCSGMTVEQVPDRWQNCRKCVYPGFGDADLNPLDNQTLKLIPTPDLYKIYTDFGCISSQPNEFAQQISSFFFSIVGAIAFLFFIYGAGVVATSRSDPGRLNKGKRIIYGSIAGLLFALFSVFILRFIASGVGLPNFGG